MCAVLLPAQGRGGRSGLRLHGKGGGVRGRMWSVCCRTPSGVEGGWGGELESSQPEKGRKLALERLGSNTRDGVGSGVYAPGGKKATFIAGMLCRRKTENCFIAVSHEKKEGKKKDWTRPGEDRGWGKSATLARNLGRRGMTSRRRRAGRLPPATDAVEAGGAGLMVTPTRGWGFCAKKMDLTIRNATSVTLRKGTPKTREENETFT